MSYKSFLAVILLLMVFCSASGQTSTETRNFIKSFHVGKETTLEVTNKYGAIQVTSWKKDSVYIKAEIKAFGPDPSKLSSMFDGISIDLNEAGPVVKAQTNFTQNINRLFESFKGMTSKMISYDSRVEINYYINAPEYLNLKIDNKYGDVYMESCSGKISVSLSNGSFKAGSLGGESSLSLSFCDAAIVSVSSGSIDASFSEVAADELGKISFNSISSKYQIKIAGDIMVESKRDKFTFNSVASLSGNSYFTDFSVRELKRELNLTTRYGNINCDKINRGFESINVNSGYADIFLNFEENSSYNLDVRHLNSFLSLPSKNSKTDQKILDEQKKEYITFGTVGTSPGNAKVKIDATRCKIYLK